MAFTLEYLVQERIIFANTFGVMTQSELVKLAEEAFALGTIFGVTRYLVDHLDMTPDISTIDLFDLPKVHQRLGLSGDVKVAAVYSEHNLKKEDFELYQMRAW
ncbi:MAG: hypothetical protein ACREO2_11620, partial [Arenimonas sp.]